MTKPIGRSTNLLGDVRAEQDTQMLTRAFIETADFKALLTTTGQTVVVGRRGTGKSALTYALKQHWEKQKNALLFVIAPEEEHVIALRPSLRCLGDKVVQVRTAVKLAWTYALLLEIAAKLLSHYKAGKEIKHSAFLIQSLSKWNKAGDGVISLTREILTSISKKTQDPENFISELMEICASQRLANSIHPVFEEFGLEAIILIDKLDEGYDQDNIGVGLVDGVIYGMHDFCRFMSRAKASIFLRDNIYRTLADRDPDFSRNIEGCTIRLHWDSFQLFTLTTTRMRNAFGFAVENDTRLWNRCVAGDLQGREGFEKCLRKTLYRPRDLLHLLNNAFYLAAKESRDQIILKDTEAAAQSISDSRLHDLVKEYEAVFPGISRLVKSFNGQKPSISYSTAISCIETAMTADSLAPAELQHFQILGSPRQLLLSLYGVGFVGVQDKETSIYKFSHDGKSIDIELNESMFLLIHPCYWIALRLDTPDFSERQANEIYDEFEISISSETRERRTQQLGQLIAELDKIPLGHPGAALFEDWALQSLKVLFAGKLRNIESKPNGSSTQRRDIVATNMCDTAFWRRIFEDFSARQVVFEVKNYEDLGRDEYRQALSYSGNTYGKIVFIITRAKDNELRAEKELEWFKEIYHQHHGVMVVKLSARIIAGLLSKLRTPGKHDETEDRFIKLLDQYERLYVSGRGGVTSSRPKGRRSH